MNEKALGNLVANHKFLRGFWYSVMQILNVDKVQYENKLLSNCLKKYKADIIVAHFGLMGARLVDVAVNSGIPMIVVFHGYDAWHSDQLKASEHNYKILFEEAAHVVGVSQDICQQLQRLGCPVSKISYLPAYVSSMYFEEHSLVEPSVVTFLSVGRFAMTKAPFLLIEVFSRVAKELPDSKLVMVGADDGGNLFEACHILAKGLGIEKQVIFKGSLGREEVMNEMLHATMLVQHSVKTPLHDDKEGTPVGIMEAMLLGLPIVATAHAGISEMIENEVSGLLVEEYDVDGMADSMLRLAKDDRLRKTLGAKAAEIIRSKEEVMRNTELFSEIIDQFKLRR